MTTSNSHVKLNFLRTFRVLRPLRFIQRLKGMRVLVQSTLQAIPELAAVLGLCLFVFVLFGIMAVSERENIGIEMIAILNFLHLFSKHIFLLSHTSSLPLSYILFLTLSSLYMFILFLFLISTHTFYTLYSSIPFFILLYSLYTNIYMYCTFQTGAVIRRCSTFSMSLNPLSRHIRLATGQRSFFI